MKISVLQNSSFIMICFGSIKCDCLILSEMPYKGSYRNFRKITIWECYKQNSVKMSSIIKGLKCI